MLTAHTAGVFLVHNLVTPSHNVSNPSLLRFLFIRVGGAKSAFPSPSRVHLTCLMIKRYSSSSPTELRETGQVLFSDVIN